MPLPPILEVFVVWHPHDKRGQIVAEALLRHFHSATFSGLAGGAVEVYERSEGWHRQGGPPRPLSCMQAWPNGLPNAQFTAVIPVIGTYLARAYAEGGEWRRYVDEIAAASEPSMFLVPIWLSSQLTSTEIDSALGAVQGITLQRRASSDCLCRDVSQAIAQTISALSGDADRIEVFISHTKYESIQEQGQGDLLRQQVSNSIQASRLADFFDAHDIQAGTKWAEAISGKAAKCALLMVRTDHYSGREWTQIEVAVAKENDLPIVCLHALQAGEERGSFLMDHVPTVRCDPDNPRAGIEMALNRIVDEALKRCLWRAQSVYLEKHGFDWLPVHSPEPITASHWLGTRRGMKPNDGPTDDHFWVIHPDPPLGPREKEAVSQLCRLAGYSDNVDIFTPRTFAARGGRLP